MEITTKFKPGDRVWMVVQRREKVRCEACNGKGYIRLRTRRRVTCGACFGQGTRHVNSDREQYVAVETTLGEMEIRLDRGDKEPTVRFDVSGGEREKWRYENDLFATKEQAEADADRIVKEKASQEEAEEARRTEDLAPEAEEAVEEEEDIDLTKLPRVTLTAYLWFQPSRFANDVRKEVEDEIRRTLERPGYVDPFAHVEVVAVDQLDPQ